MSQYPKWLYHASQEPRIVADEAAHKALGPGWAESPADAKAAPAAPKAAPIAEPQPEPEPETLHELGAKLPEPHSSKHHPKRVK